MEIILLKIDGSSEVSEKEDRILKRYSVLNQINYLIEESVYYRTYTDDIVVDKREILYNYQNNSGSLEIK